MSPDLSVKGSSKSPVINDWTNLKDLEIEDIENWNSRYPRARNTGVVCGRFVGIDIADAAIVERIKAAAFKMLGKDAPVRVGRTTFG